VISICTKLNIDNDILGLDSDDSRGGAQSGIEEAYPNNWGVRGLWD
jgi:hypothetical protein